MIVDAKSGIKLIGVSVVTACAVFVCTFFLNYYADVQSVVQNADATARELLDAQIATAKITSVITGGVLGVLAAGMLAFYVKLFIDAESKRLGMLKALGYSNAALSAQFWVFGLSVLIGACAGYGGGWAVMSFIYRELTLPGMPNVTVRFHAELFFALAVAPPILLGAAACAFAAIALRKSPNVLLRGNAESSKKSGGGVKVCDKSFLSEMRIATLRGKKSAVVFVAFACFCFSAMVQMGASMFDFGGAVMSLMILAIGVILSVTALIMAVTTVVNRNKRNIAVMKAFGYSKTECATAVLAGYIPFALLGFAAGTVYQFGLLYAMINIVFENVLNMQHYVFDVPVFFITLAAFSLCYVAFMLFYSYKIDSVSVKYAMSEE
mgnify:FL=1